VAVFGLGELDLSECAPFEHVEHERLHFRTDGLQDVKRHALPCLGVVVDDPEAGVEADRLAGQDRLGFEKGEDVVQECVDRSLSLAISAGASEH
jgi:hypothetical protein